MSGAISAVRKRLLERRDEVKKLTATVVPAIELPQSSSVTSKASSANLKKDSHNALAAKAERTRIASDATKSVPPKDEKEAPPTDGGGEAKRAKLSDLVTKSTGVERTSEKGEKLATPPELSLEALLAAKSTKERESQKVSDEILEMLNKPTAMDLALIEKFRSDGSQVREFCAVGTREECAKLREGGREPCRKLHFSKIIQRHTDTSLGDCSFLNTCFHMDTCKYIHYEVDYGAVSTKSPKSRLRPSDDAASTVATRDGAPDVLFDGSKVGLYPAQWIHCDLRFFDLAVLGKFSVVMADPPWDIHMELPYGTMSDHEMRSLQVQLLQDDGLIFLWVTGRAMELGRECLQIWGYRQCDELIWVKTNQLQRIIRTGRTGHWMNHGKEHCLVGAKGSLHKFYKGLDCDVLVGEVRATSHKPDEIYGVIERLSPGTRKIELFGRLHNVQPNWCSDCDVWLGEVRATRHKPDEICGVIERLSPGTRKIELFGRLHNVQPNWMTLGNQLDGVRLLEPEVVRRYQTRYPTGDCMPNLEQLNAYKKHQQQQHQLHPPHHKQHNRRIL